MIRTQTRKALIYPPLVGGSLSLVAMGYLLSHEILMPLVVGTGWLVFSLLGLLAAPFNRFKSGFTKAEVLVGKKRFYVRFPGQDYIPISLNREKLRVSQVSGTLIRMKVPGLIWVGTPLEIEFPSAKDVESIVEELRHV